MDANEKSIALFTDNFDGEGHTISNLIIDKSNYIGLFAKIDPGSGKENSVKNLILDNFKVTGKNNVGTLVGYIDGMSTIKNVIANSVDANGESQVGGLIGYINGGGVKIIDGKVNGGTVDSLQGDNIGGLIGHADNTSISNSYAISDVTGNNRVGGLVSIIDIGLGKEHAGVTGTIGVTGASDIEGAESDFLPKFIPRHQNIC